MDIGITTSVTKKGQVTIPASIRKLLGISERDKVEFRLEGKEVKLRPVKGIVAARFGVVKPVKKPEDFKKLREIFEQGVVDEVISETK